MKLSLKTLFSLSLALTIGLSSCDTPSYTPINPKDKPEHSEEHKDDHEHDHDHDHDHDDDHEPASAVLSLYLGHFHGKNNFHQNAWPKEMKYYTNPQVIKLEKKDGAWVIASDSPAKVFAVTGGREMSETDIDMQAGAYGLDIKYYDEDGELLNGHISEEGAIEHHQHFFFVKNIRPSEEGVEANYKPDADFYRYVYMDTEIGRAHV